MENDNTKISLPQFLKLLTSNMIHMHKAINIAGKVYKGHNTPEALAQLNDNRLKELGVDSQEERNLFMNALRKAGYTIKAGSSKKNAEASGSHSPTKRTSTKSSNLSSSTTSQKTSPKRKRKQADSGNELLPSAPSDDVDETGNWDFEEVLDEEVLRPKLTVINRAPVMMAWAMLVAEKMHFSRPEALSIASAYTEMNAVTKGVSLGVYRSDEDRGREALKYGTQPYVELIGRRIPLYRTNAGEWRALSNGKPVPPVSAFQYILRSFRETTPFIMGSLKLLVDSYNSKEINDKAWALYAEFRPEVNEWGKRSEVYCSVILNLRKKVSAHTQEDTNLAKDQKPTVNYEIYTEQDQASDEPRIKKARTLTLEEYEAALDADTTFDGVNLDFGISQVAQDTHITPTPQINQEI